MRKFKFRRVLSVVRYIIPTIRFNFHYLPFRQAVKLPILLYKPRLLNLKGTVSIEGPVHTGMIKLGFEYAKLYPNAGIQYENGGGKLIFEGEAQISASSFISIGKYGCLRLGDDFVNNAQLRIACYHSITVGKRTRFGYDTMMMDSNFHRLKNEAGEFVNTGVGAIVIGNYNWIATRCMVMPGTHTQDYTIVAANSLINRTIDESKVIVAGSPATIKKRGIWRDMDDDQIDFEAIAAAQNQA